MTVEGFLKAMDRAVDKQRQEQASLVNCVWATDVLLLYHNGFFLFCLLIQRF